MEHVIKIITAVEPILIAIISMGALVLVPVIVKAILEKLNRDQQRFAYDVAKGVVQALDLIDDKTPTKIDDALLAVARQVEEQLGRSLKDGEKKAVHQAVLSSTGRRILAGK
jgi:hypothetical protein